MAFIIRDGDICCLDSAVVYHFRWYRGAVYYYRGVVYYYGVVFIRPRLVLLEKCCFPGCWHSSGPGRNKGLVRHLVYGSFQKPYPQRALSSFFRLRLLLIVLCWGVNANMKERGLSTWYKIKLALYTPGLFATTDDHEGFTLARLIDRTQEVAVSRTQHLLLHYSS